MKSSYSFEDRGTDRKTESISECTLKDFLDREPWGVNLTGKVKNLFLVTIDVNRL